MAIQLSNTDKQWWIPFSLRPSVMLHVIHFLAMPTRTESDVDRQLLKREGIVVCKQGYGYYPACLGKVIITGSCVAVYIRYVLLSSTNVAFLGTNNLETD